MASAYSTHFPPKAPMAAARPAPERLDMLPRRLPPAQSAGSSAKGGFSNDWKIFFQWLENSDRISNDWKNFVLRGF
jgi:hypothetical protein